MEGLTPFHTTIVLVYFSKSFQIPDHRFYSKAMQYFNTQYTNIFYLLISEDEGWVSQNIANLKEHGNITVNPTGLNRTQDYVLLSSCNHSIINYGSFGYISALFANGITIVYNLGAPLNKRI